MALELVVSGLLSNDDFDDAIAVPDLRFYTFRSISQYYALVQGGDGTRRLEDNNAGGVGHSLTPIYRNGSLALEEMCVQCNEVRSTNLFEDIPGLALMVQYPAGGAVHAYYHFSLERTRLALYRITNVSTTETIDTLANTNVNVTSGSNLSLPNTTAACVHAMKFHCAPGFQQGWLDFDPALTVVGANAVLVKAGEPGVAAIAGGGTPVSGWRDLIVMRGNAITVTGLETGQYIQIDGDSNLEATEVGGVASVDIGHRSWPRTTLRIFAADDTLLQVLTPAAGLWGGDVYTVPVGGEVPETPDISVDDVGASFVDLVTTAYVHPTLIPHLATQWQLTTAADTEFATPLRSELSVTQLRAIRFVGLTASTNYLARARYFAQDGGASEWSTAAAFATIATDPQTPWVPCDD